MPEETESTDSGRVVTGDLGSRSLLGAGNLFLTQLH
jgi:hypothetical protein